MYSLQNLNIVGQISLAFTGNALVNIAVHPLCTLKNRLMAKENLLATCFSDKATKKAFSLYRGYTAICITESLAYTVTLFANSWLQHKNFSVWNASLFAGLASAPLIAIGESLMLDQQIGTKSFSKVQHRSAKDLTTLLKRAMGISSLLATIMREVP